MLSCLKPPGVREKLYSIFQWYIHVLKLRIFLSREEEAGWGSDRAKKLKPAAGFETKNQTSAKWEDVCGKTDMVHHHDMWDIDTWKNAVASQ